MTLILQGKTHSTHLLSNDHQVGIVVVVVVVVGGGRREEVAVVVVAV